MKTNLTQRDNSQWLQNTADLVREARQRADDAEWNNRPNAHRLRREAEMLEERYGAGETLTPRF